MKLLNAIQNKFGWHDTFVITQNDHGLLFKAGFEEHKVWEIFGNVNYLQCPHGKVFKCDKYKFLVSDHQTIPKWDQPVCQCETPEHVRPNILLRNDKE